MKKGDILELQIEDYAFEGKGIARIDRPDSPDGKKYVVFVQGAYPGETVEAMLVKVKKSFSEAKTTKILEKSSEREEAKCSHFGVCGGCKCQDMEYSAQAKYKEAQVRDIFERLGGFKDLEVLPIIKSSRQFFYRNKMEYSFARKRWLTKEEINSDQDFKDRDFALGLHVPNVYDKVIDIKACYLQSEASNRVLSFTRDFFKKENASIYESRLREGYLRNLVIKTSYLTHQIMVNLVTSEENNDLMAKYTEGLLDAVPEVSTVVNNICTRQAQVAFGDYEICYYGEGSIQDSIGGYKFRISPNSFFQMNSPQAELLYSKALAFADLTGKETVYDLYSGAGTISIFVSGKAKEVYAFESVEAAIKDAGANSEANGIKNVKYFLQDLNHSFRPLVQDRNIPKPDVIITDPPRSGMNPKTVADILALKPERVVYISCNPSTQVRDVSLLCEGGYSLVRVQPVDMFPNTYHIESIALLQKE